MIRNVILDAGPLVAFLMQAEMHHSWSVRQFQQIQRPFLTCEAVIGEACFLLRQSPAAIQKIHTFLERGDLTIDFTLAAKAGRVFGLMHDYRDTPMSLADACLVCMVETLTDGRICTLDSDFRIYRQHRRGAIPLISP